MFRTLSALTASAAMIVAAPASAEILEFTADIRGENERPNPVDTPAFGTGTFTLDTETNEFTFTVLFTEALFSSPETGAHVHGPATPDQNADVLIPLPLGQLKQGTVDLDDIAGADPEDLINNLWYVNIHSQDFPGGEIRGQIILIPEPGTALMAAGGLLAACVTRRRRRS